MPWRLTAYARWKGLILRAVTLSQVVGIVQLPQSRCTQFSWEPRVCFRVKKPLSLEKKGFDVFVSLGGGQMYQLRDTGLSIISLETSCNMCAIYTYNVHSRSIVDCIRDNIFIFHKQNENNSVVSYVPSHRNAHDRQTIHNSYYTTLYAVLISSQNYHNVWYVNCPNFTNVLTIYFIHIP